MLDRIRSDPPIVFRPTEGAVYLAGGAAGPIGGDIITLDIDVGPGAALTLKGVGATVSLPGPGPSYTDVSISLGEGAYLDWDLEPFISVAGSDHVQRTTITAAPNATFCWREITVMGRTSEEPGCLSSVLRLVHNGSAVLHHELRIGQPGWNGPAVMGGHRVILQELSIGGTTGEGRVLEERSWGSVWVISENISFMTVVGATLEEVKATSSRLSAKTALSRS